MMLTIEEQNDAAGRALVGAAAASNADALTDEYEDDAEQAILAQGLEPLGDEFSAHSASGPTFRGPTDVNSYE